jgi:chromosome segregation protein
MVLRSLSIFGFKSFADKTTVQFGEGITAVIGPNGCGKSNVVDAIRWVFGEQKASVLRSSLMADVIFSGSQKRQPLNLAEVTLTIENTRGILPTEFSQVGITRRLYRTGESEYLLNKMPCRLRDIQDLFVDTGVGDSAYTTIAQGMTDLITKGRAEDRRQLFDEAAGIGKYKQRRKESQRQLERTTQDLLRINDMVAEADRQVRMLARHVEKAQRYKRYYDELKTLEVGFENTRYRRMAVVVAERRAALEEQKTQLEMHRAKIATAESEIEQRELAALKKEEELQGAGARVLQAGERINQLYLDISVTGERVRGLEESIVRLTHELEQMARSMNEKSELRAQIEKSMTERRARYEECRQRLITAVEELGAFDNGILASREQADQLGVEQLASLKAVGEKRNTLANLEANLSNALERTDRLNREATTVEARIAQYTDAAEQRRTQLATLGDAQERLVQSRETLLGRIDKEDAQAQTLLGHEKRCEAQIDASQAQLRFLGGLDAAFEGYESGVKALLTEKLPGLVGTAADCLTPTDASAISLVERALGSAIQTVVFQSDEQLAGAMAFLEGRRAGAARMVSLERLTARPRPVSSGAGRGLRAMVTTAPEHAVLADYLLGHVRVTDSAPEALHSARNAEAGEVYLSPDGAVCFADGTVIAGRKAGEEAGLLHRKVQIDQLKRDVERLEKEYQSIVHDKEICIINRDEAKFALAEVDEKITVGRQEQQEQETSIKHLENEVQNSRVRLDELTIEATALQQTVDELEAHIGEGRTALEADALRLAELERRIETVKQELAQMEGRRGGMAEHVKNLELEVHGLENRITQDASDIERLGREIADLTARQQALRAQLEAAKALRVELEAAMVAVREGYNGMLAQVEEIRKLVKVEQAAADEVQGMVHTLDMDQMRDEQEMRKIRERIWEVHEVDLESPPAPIAAVDEDEGTVRQNIEMLRERIKRVGQVNMAALEDFERESERLKTLTAQRDDLQVAVNDLEKAIKKLDREARAQFLATFELAQKNFAEMFTTLFEGGEATIALEENVDPLEASIAINARPAGKKMRDVQALSGGEQTLTAIALLFGLYLVKPSAYCILDELDGPLDDANIGRFVRVLRRFAERTQFIVITHNKLTMEAADLLYGVTQEEKGISRLVSVKVDELVAQSA